ncbi:MAG TPA: spermidine synthase-like protein [Myxococcota bacterium]|nr:spermidine synthase-like protein [Myxococcota bacterium]
MVIELPTPFEGETGVVRVLEPAGCDRRAIAERLREERYGKAFVADDGVIRTLHFCRDFMQSAMRVDDPFALEFAYTRMVMSFLLFVPRPGSILMLGMGGGSIAKFCHRHLPGARIVVVESEPRVVGFRDQFAVPPDDERFQVVLADGAEYLRRTPERFDAIVIDAFDRDGFAPTICTPEFYLEARDSLAPGGVMVSNLVGTREARTDHLHLVRGAFEDNVILMPVVGDGNHLAFAFPDGREPRWRWIREEAKAMRARYGLEFPRFAEQLERSRKMGYLRRELEAPRHLGRHT